MSNKFTHIALTIGGLGLGASLLSMAPAQASLLYDNIDISAKANLGKKSFPLFLKEDVTVVPGLPELDFIEGTDFSFPFVEGAAGAGGVLNVEDSSITGDIFAGAFAEIDFAGFLFNPLAGGGLGSDFKELYEYVYEYAESISIDLLLSDLDWVGQPEGKIVGVHTESTGFFEFFLGPSFDPLLSFTFDDFVTTDFSDDSVEFSVALEKLIDQTLDQLPGPLLMLLREIEAGTVEPSTLLAAQLPSYLDQDGKLFIEAVAGFSFDADLKVAHGDVKDVPEPAVMTSLLLLGALGTASKVRKKFNVLG